MKAYHRIILLVLQNDDVLSDLLSSLLTRAMQAALGIIAFSVQSTALTRAALKSGVVADK